MRPERDLIVIPGARTDRSEPLDEAGVITKLGIDATRRAQDRADWSWAQPPAAAIQKARELLGSTTNADRIGQH
jgi:4-hydroxy-3-polyprenylbenzoate decarboxylase